MNIIIEGVDCAGKSTLSKELKNSLHYDLIALHHHDTNQFKRYLRMYANMEKTIFERSHISEIVYSKLYNRKTPFTPLEQSLLDSLIQESCIIIHALPDIDTMKKRYLERKNVLQSIRIEEMEKCREEFLDYMQKFPHVIVYESRDWEEMKKLIGDIQKQL